MKILNYITAFLLLTYVLASCSSTSGLEPDEQLYTGLKKIKYTNYKSCQHFSQTQEEIEAALATAPNGALFGSSYYRTPFPYGLWIWNACKGKDDAISKWLNSSFGKAPVIMQDVNPELRSSVAQTVLQNKGYFRGKVDYDIIEGKPSKAKNDTISRPRTAKIAYKVDLGTLFTLDSIEYIRFPETNYNLIKSSESLLHNGDPFDIGTLDEERNRLYNLFRDNGYFFYDKSYTSYLADTTSVSNKVQIRLQLTDSLPEEAYRKYYIGKTSVNIANTYGEKLNDSVSHRRFTMRFNGKKPKVRPRVIFNNVKLRNRQLFSQTNYQESVNNLISTGIFSNIDFRFTPREETDTLDMLISTILEKPYDITLEANYKGKTTGRMGPGVSLGFAKRNAFRGGEVLSLNLAANYEIQTGSNMSTNMNSYEFSGDITLEMPRLALPLIKKYRRRWYTTPTTIVRGAAETINRAGFFRRNILSAELNYTFQPTRQIRHQWSPLIFEYDYMASTSEEFQELLANNYFMQASMQDRFIPKMRYTFTYTSAETLCNPIYFSMTVSESANIISLARMTIGKPWNEKNKPLFHNTYSQFLKFEAEWKKTWQLTEYDYFIAHVAAGLIWSYGNSDTAPYSERFYVGGANSLRAFNIRTIGPASYHTDDRSLAYISQTGDTKLVINLEWRPRLFGSLYGAIFADAGNIWTLKDLASHYSSNTKFKPGRLVKDIALNIGAGLRYDLDYFVLRLDWGVALHTPYDTGRNGYFNTKHFRDSQCLNFAIGYPF